MGDNYPYLLGKAKSPLFVRQIVPISAIAAYAKTNEKSISSFLALLSWAYIGLFALERPGFYSWGMTLS